MRVLSRWLLMPLLILGLSGFSKQKAPPAEGYAGQPAEERAAQDELPISNDRMWTTLHKTKIRFDEKTGNYSAAYPEAIKTMVGKKVTISGFILPLEQTEKFTHFILSKRTPTCPFCPPGEPNEIIDVTLEKPITWAEESVKVTGTFGLMNNQQLGMFFLLKPAKKVE